MVIMPLVATGGAGVGDTSPTNRDHVTYQSTTADGVTAVSHLVNNDRFMSDVNT